MIIILSTNPHTGDTLYLVQWAFGSDPERVLRDWKAKHYDEAKHAGFTFFAVKCAGLLDGSIY